MARSGDVIENPVSGETMVFLQTADDTEGELAQIDLFVRSGGGVSVAHIHPHQEERFVVRRGRMTLQVGHDEMVLREGDEAIVPAGVDHFWWNSGEEELNALLELRPAGRFEQMVSTFFGLAKSGHVDEAGVPRPLQLAVTLDEFRDTIRMPEATPFAQNVVIPTLAWIGRRLGLRGEYPYPRSARVNGGMEIWRGEGALTGSGR